MPEYNIVVVEDNELHRNALVKGLTEDFGHSVKDFRDQQTLETARADNTLLEWPEGDRRLVVLLDIMLAEQLDETEPYAPRRTGGDEPPKGEKEYVNDMLGLHIGKKIRDGEFELGIPRTTPILFFTARRNERIRREMEDLKRAMHIEKPAFIDDVQTAIEELMVQTEPDSQEKSHNE